MTVLLVEDHRALAQWLTGELQHAGWTVVRAGTAAEAQQLVRRRTYDVLLVDIGLPDADGVDLCQELRTITPAPILMITARHDIPERVRALDHGADDYLPKPFAIEELVARMRAILRRTRGEPGPVLECGPARIFVEERRVEVEGQTLTLTRREFDLLVVLARHPGRVFARDALLESAWGYDFYGESNVVDVTIRRLRSRLEPFPALDVQAVRGVGYRLMVVA
ncbi:MAG: response regulator transcription factor [Thermaerobacter sp.]|nr:response regulator transcription factor [Thermaerobacter sp.]